MKTARFFRMTLWLAGLMLVAACSSSKGLGRHSDRMQDEQNTTSKRRVKSDDVVQRGQQKAVNQASKQDTLVTKGTIDRDSYLGQVADNAQQVRFITSKIKFSVESGNRKMTLTGNLKMKRDDVIRLQLMAFGFVEAGRLEFTKDYVLIVDRINKQFLQVPYAQLDFLRINNIDFYTLQALFWNETYEPAVQRGRGMMQAEPGMDNDVVLHYERGYLSYRWLTDGETARIKMANIKYSDNFRSYQLNWDYEDFKANDRKFFPTKHIVSFSTPDRIVKFEMKLNYIGRDEDWETRTELSGKYRQMPVDDILRRFMSL